MIETLPLPVTGHPLDAPFWEGARRGELVVQRCDDCGAHRFPPRLRCPDCHSDRHSWPPVSGRGAIYSFVVPRPPLLPVFERRSPYVVALVSLAELPGIRLLGALIEAQPGQTIAAEPSFADVSRANISRVNIGAPVQAAFVPVAEDVHLLHWRLLS